MRLFILITLLTFSYSSLIAQGCCSGASGNPIAGGASSGVLLKDQLLQKQLEYMKIEEV